MPVEQRVVSKQKIGARPVEAVAAATVAADAPKGGGRRRLLAVVVVVLVAAGAAAWFLLGRGAAGADEPAHEPEPVPGEVVQVDAISINLADGHYLRLGLGLQLTADAGGHGPIDPSRALDAAIALYSGRAVGEVSDAATRDALKAQLTEQLVEAYDGEVMGVYLTNYVTQ